MKEAEVVHTYQFLLLTFNLAMYSAAPEKGLRMRGDIVMDNQEYVGKSTSRRRFQKNVGLAESDSGEEEDGDDGEEVENEDQSDDENEQAEQDR